METDLIKIPLSQVESIAGDMRYDILTMVHNCGKENGHLGGCMSAVELLAVLYTQIMNINQVAHSGADWAERDRFIMSKGHAGIAMYAALKHVGLVSREMIEGPIRGEDTVLYRHPKRNIKYGIECSVGSLGMGLGYGIGLAESFRRKKTTQKVYVMLGDGECDEGSVWESAAYAGFRGLDNLVVVIDKNGLQLDGITSEVMAIENMSERWAAFGFLCTEIDGHDINAINKAFHIKHEGKPLAIIANTVKGKGISFAENKVEWHDNYLDDELYVQGKRDIQMESLDYIRYLANERYRTRRINLKEQYNNRSWVVLSDNIEQTRIWHKRGPKNVIGEVSLQIAGQDNSFTLIYSDCANRIGISKLKQKHPEKCYEVGISEQNQVTMAAAMAHEGFNVFAVAYAPFITARVLDQIRVNLGYMNAPVSLIGLSAGMASSDLGATHTAFEDIANLRGIPNMQVLAPADTYEIAKDMEYTSNIDSPAYIRITIPHTVSQVVKDRENYNPQGYDFISSGKDIAVITCGSIITDVVNAVENLKNIGLEVSIYKVNSIKPFPEDLINKLGDYSKLISVEEHSIIGGLGSTLAEIIASDRTLPELYRVGTNDCYYTADTASNIRAASHLDSYGLAQFIKEIIGA